MNTCRTSYQRARARFPCRRRVTFTSLSRTYVFTTPMLSALRKSPVAHNVWMRDATVLGCVRHHFDDALTKNINEDSGLRNSPVLRKVTADLLFKGRWGRKQCIAERYGEIRKKNCEKRTSLLPQENILRQLCQINKFGVLADGFLRDFDGLFLAFISNGQWTTIASVHLFARHRTNNSAFQGSDRLRFIVLPRTFFSYLSDTFFLFLSLSINRSRANSLLSFC